MVLCSLHLQQYFFDNLREYIYGQLSANSSISDTFTARDLLPINVKHEQLYTPATISFNFTSYDMLRDCDTVNAKGPKNTVLVHVPPANGHDTQHPWRYARVLGIYHFHAALSSLGHALRIGFLVGTTLLQAITSTIT